MDTLNCLQYFKAIPSDPDFEIHDVLNSPDHPYYSSVQDDLKSIDEVELQDFCIKFHIDFYLQRELDKDMGRRRWFLVHELRRQISCERNYSLRDYLIKRPSPYDAQELQNISLYPNQLVDIQEFRPCINGLIKNDYVFQICPSLPQFNSSHWLSEIIIHESFRNHRNFKVRLAPFIRIAKENYNPMFFKMSIFGKKLEWERIKTLKEEEFGQWLGDELSSDSVGITDFVWTPLKDEVHFTCEELPKYEDISERGSRYFHAIFNKSSGKVIHCDGAIRFFTEDEFINRQKYHVRNSEATKIGQRIKLFQIDEPIEKELFLNLTTTFFVWNQDAINYFND